MNGRWILAGGRDAFGSLQGAVAWDPVGNAWTTVNGMPTPAFSTGAATIGAAFYAVGGDAFGRTNLTRRYTEGVACTATPTATVTATPTRTNANADQHADANADPHRRRADQHADQHPDTDADDHPGERAAGAAI